MKRVFYLLPVLLAISLIPFSLAQNHDVGGELVECRDGLIVVKMISDERRSCLPPETAERWVELGIGIIIDKNYTPEIETEPESILEIPEETVPELPTPKVNETDQPTIQEKVELQLPMTPVEFLDEIEIEEIIVEEIPQPVIETPEQSKTTPLPGTPRKVGSQGIQAFGSLVLEVYDKDGNLKHRHAQHNLVVNIGLQSLSDLAFGTTHVSGESAGGFTYISVGTGATAPVAGNTDCETQHGAKKQDLSVTNTALGGIINVSWVAELTAGTLTEICLTDNASPATGNLFSRQTFAGVPIVGTDTVNAEWTITFADAP